MIIETEVQKKQCQITDRIEISNSFLDTLQNNINILEEKLIPISINLAPEKELEKEGSELVPLASELRTQANKINQSILQIQSMIDRLEI